MAERARRNQAARSQDGSAVDKGALPNSPLYGLTIQALCDRLYVTKGSFYHHFSAIPAFVQAFADHWEDSLQALLNTYRAQPDRYARIELLINATAALPHEAEAALRAWGSSEPIIRAAQDRIDIAGEQLVMSAVSMFVRDPERAALVAHHGVSLAVGLQHRKQPIDRERYLEVLADWLRLSVGVDVDVVMTPRGHYTRVHRPRHQPRRSISRT